MSMPKALCLLINLSMRDSGQTRRKRRLLLVTNKNQIKGDNEVEVEDVDIIMLNKIAMTKEVKVTREIISKKTTMKTKTRNTNKSHQKSTQLTFMIQEIPKKGQAGAESKTCNSKKDIKQLKI